MKERSCLPVGPPLQAASRSASEKGPPSSAPVMLAPAVLFEPPRLPLPPTPDPAEPPAPVASPAPPVSPLHPATTLRPRIVTRPMSLSMMRVPSVSAAIKRILNAAMTGRAKCDHVGRQRGDCAIGRARAPTAELCLDIGVLADGDEIAAAAATARSS